MTQALQSALTGIRNNLDDFRKAAESIAEDESQEFLAENLVQLKVSQRGVEANARAAKTADELAGTLLDLLG